MSARPLRDLFGVVCSTAILHRAAARTLARDRRFSWAGVTFALRLEERVAGLHEELSSGPYRHGRYTLIRVVGSEAAGDRLRALKPEPQPLLQPLDTTATH